MLKPEGGPVYEWLAEQLSDLQPYGVRIAAPVAARNGDWLCHGWTATRWVQGSHPDLTQPSAWVDILEAGRAFHRTVMHVGRPACLDERTDVWALADRAAWDECTTLVVPQLADIARVLREAAGPLGPSHLVHGDLTGNVLVAAGLPPAVIDISPYWRPPEYAEGVIVADALCWHGARASLLAEVGVSVSAVARALLFRLLTVSGQLSAGRATADLHAEVQRYRRAAALIGL